MKTYQFPVNIEKSYFCEGQEVDALNFQIFSHIRNKLESKGIEFNFHSLGVPDVHNDGTPCINYEQGLWTVYSVEKGLRRKIALFQSPWDAADFFISRMTLT